MQVDIVTPSKEMVTQVEVDTVTLPGELGEMQVLPGHTELLTILNTGILSFDETGTGKSRHFAVSYGFAEVAGDRITVLAETCEESKDIDLKRAQDAQAKAEQILSGELKEGQFNKYQLKLQRSLIRQKVSVS